MEDSLLGLNIKMLKLMGLWTHEGSKIKHYLHFILMYAYLYLAGLVCFCGIVRQSMYGIDDLEGFVESTIAFLDWCGMMYMQHCFTSRLEKIRNLILSIEELREFCPPGVIEDTESNVRKYTTGFFIYAILGNLLNAALSLMDKSNCEKSRNPAMALRDPCGSTVRGYWLFDIDNSYLYWTAILACFQACLIASLIAFAITTLLIGALMHTIAQLKYCRKMLNDSCQDFNQSVAKEKVIICVKYHRKIIRLSEAISDSFSQQMVLHITVTSIVISILGFEILSADTFQHAIRFVIQLLGWSFFLYVTCFFAQQLIDESLLIGFEAYSTPWYNKPVGVQQCIKMVIMRAQNPLKLNAINLGVMSLSMFLMVMKSAYSYFTLLLNMKN